MVQYGRNRLNEREKRVYGIREDTNLMDLISEYEGGFQPERDYKEKYRKKDKNLCEKLAKSKEFKKQNKRGV